MATPSINDFIRYINKKLSGSNWNTNLQKIISFLTDGTSDFNVNSLNTTNDITSGRDITAVGNITANKFIGDGSDITGLNEWRKNFIINGTCLIKNNADYTLVKDQYGTSVDRFDGMATGTSVSAGTLTQTTTANCGKTGYAIKFNQVTLTGTGIIYLRHRLYNKSAVNFKNSLGSFSMRVWHNVSSTINYTIYLNKANSLNDFTNVTAINNSGGLGVLPSTSTQLKYENVNLGDCSNGLEILIKVECGEVTLKDFEFAELQLELGNNSTEFEYRNSETDGAYNAIDKDFNIVGNFIGNLTGTSYGTMKRIYSNTLTEQTNIIDISNLNGSSDIEYELRIFGKKTTGLPTPTDSDIQLIINDDTSNNYYNNNVNASYIELMPNQSSSNSNLYIKANIRYSPTIKLVVSNSFAGSNFSTQNINSSTWVSSNNILSLIIRTKVVIDPPLMVLFDVGTIIELYVRR